MFLAQYYRILYIFKATERKAAWSKQTKNLYYTTEANISTEPNPELLSERDVIQLYSRTTYIYIRESSVGKSPFGFDTNEITARELANMSD